MSEVFQPGDADKIKWKLRAVITEKARDTRCAGGLGDNGEERLWTILSFLNLGMTCKEAPQGILVGPHEVLFAVKSKKYRAPDGKWTPYRCAGDVFSNGPYSKQ